jgi:hypothetical protein
VREGDESRVSEELGTGKKGEGKKDRRVSFILAVCLSRKISLISRPQLFVGSAKKIVSGPQIFLVPRKKLLNRIEEDEGGRETVRVECLVWRKYIRGMFRMEDREEVHIPPPRASESLQEYV